MAPKAALPPTDASASVPGDIAGVWLFVGTSVLGALAWALRHASQDGCSVARGKRGGSSGVTGETSVVD
jgi:hypothetical protein